MSAFLYLGSVVSFIISGLIFSGATSAIHEGVAALFVVSAAVAFAGGAIVGAVNRVRETIEAAALAQAAAVADQKQNSQQLSETSSEG